jgi:hypothetical protein
MPDTLAQAKSINDKAAKSAARRRARLFYEKAARKAARCTASATPTRGNTSELVELDQLRTLLRLRSEQEARSRDRVELHNQSFREPTSWFINPIRFLCRTCCGLFLLYVSIVLFYYSGVYLFNQSQ